MGRGSAGAVASAAAQTRQGTQKDVQALLRLPPTHKFPESGSDRVPNGKKLAMPGVMIDFNGKHRQFSSILDAAESRVICCSVPFKAESDGAAIQGEREKEKKSCNTNSVPRRSL